MAQAAAPARSQGLPFRAATRQVYAQQPAQTAMNWSQVLRFQLPQTGYLKTILLHCDCNVASGAGTPASNTFVAWPPNPYNCIKQLVVKTNEGLDIVNISGLGLFIWNSYARRLACPAEDLQTLFCNTSSSGNQNVQRLFQRQTGTIAASTTYQLRHWLEVPIATDDSLLWGLLLSQSNDLILTMEITAAAQADISPVTGVTLTPSFTFNPVCEFLTVPPPPNGRPDENWAHTLLEENVGVVSSGVDFGYRVPRANSYLSIIGQFENGSTLGQADSTTINNVRITYGQTNTPFNMTYFQHAVNTKRYLGKTPFDGMVVVPFNWGSGIPGYLELRDLLNTSQQTDLFLYCNLAAGFSTTNGNFRAVKEQLVNL